MKKFHNFIYSKNLFVLLFEDRPKFSSLLNLKVYQLINIIFLNQLEVAASRRTIHFYYIFLLPKNMLNHMIEGQLLTGELAEKL